jgi:hypothetical protein
VNRRDRADDDADHHHAEFRLHAHERVNFERVGSSLAAIPRGAGPPGSRRRVPFGTRRPRLGAATTTVGPRSRAESTAATTPSISSDSGRPDSVFLRFFLRPLRSPCNCASACILLGLATKNENRPHNKPGLLDLPSAPRRGTTILGSRSFLSAAGALGYRGR